MTRAIGTVESSPFAQAENTAKLEAALKADEQKQKLLHDQHLTAQTGIATPEASERENLQKAFAQSALQISELPARTTTAHEEQAARATLNDAYSKSLDAAKTAANQRKQQEDLEAFNKKFLDIHNQEAVERATIETATQHAPLNDAYAKSLDAAKTATNQRKQQESQKAFNAKLLDIQNQETTDRETLHTDAFKASENLYTNSQSDATSLEQQLQATAQSLRLLEQQQTAQAKTAANESISKEIAEATKKQTNAKETVDSMRTAALMIAGDLGITNLDKLATNDIINKIRARHAGDEHLNGLNKQYVDATTEINELRQNIAKLSTKLNQ